MTRIKSFPHPKPWVFLKFISFSVLILCFLNCSRLDQNHELPTDKIDILVDTDLGGDPDDIQSLFRLLHYSDYLQVKGIVSTPDVDNPNHPWDTIPNVEVIKEWIKRIDLDYLRNLGYSELMSEAEALEVVRAGVWGARQPGPGQQTEGTDYIIDLARQYSPENPLWILVWGAMTSTAQALHDAPDIAPNIRIYFIGTSNTLTDTLSRNFVYDFMRDQYPDLWWIESGVLPKWKHETLRGVFLGGHQEGEWNNLAFIDHNIRNHGSNRNGYFDQKSGDAFPKATSPRGSLKEGDSPSFLYLLSPLIAGIGDIDDPTQESWGGQYRHYDPENYQNYYVDLDRPMEECIATINKWRLQFLSHWKMRWDRYDRHRDGTEVFEKANEFKVTDEGEEVSVLKIFNLPDSVESIPVCFARIKDQGKRKIIIETPKTISKYSISPKRLDIKGEVNGKQLTIEIPANTKIAVYIDNYPELYLFPQKDRQEIEKTVPVDLPYYNVLDHGIEPNSKALQTQKIQYLIDSVSQQKGGVIFFPSGLYHTATVFMRSNTYLFLDQNAVISGSLDPDDYPEEELAMQPGWPRSVSPDTNGSLIYFRDVENSGILGAGMITAHGATYRRMHLPKYRWLNMIRSINSRNLHFKDFHLIDAIGWNTHIIRSDSVYFSDVKILNEIPPIGWNPAQPNGFWNNTDGINPDASTNVFVDNCFIHAGDDCITLKITNTKTGEQDDVRNIHVSNSMFQSSTGALKVGTETLGDYIEDVYFKNIDILDMRSGYPLKITPHDRSTIRKVVFEDIYLEQTKGHFLEARIIGPRTKEQDYQPVIDGIYLTNIHLFNKEVTAYIHGFSPKDKVKNIHFKNLRIEGKRIQKIDSAIFILNKNVEGIKIQ
ncbi:nucleoside hydrolase-like domain-containing protein [Pararhodonellum marinum]|uniref:nucleoside hydrolase-like domain-containing protein n=1 Tax=Pararhodonellum marinum TaxID=2755358 RepID=UPI001890ACD2|nr:nucleoside hydrolase-like domain-containing protein [Pararhodonellum marinum]